jgi:CheY-like chemotaxis protein
MNVLIMAGRDDPPAAAGGGPMRASAAREPDAGAGPHSQPAPSGPPACILLVDDDNAVRETLADLLELEGYRTLQAGDAEAALGHLEREQVDLLITDLSMPGSDGVSLIRQGQATRHQLPAILLTGYAEETGLVTASAGTQFHVLSKPVEASQLLSQIRLLLHPDSA